MDATVEKGVQDGPDGPGGEAWSDYWSTRMRQMSPRPRKKTRQRRCLLVARLASPQLDIAVIMDIDPEFCRGGCSHVDGLSGELTAE